MGFLLSRRWVLFLVAVIGLSFLAYVLGQWQFSRLDDRRDRNAVVRTNEDAAPAPVADVLAVGEAVPSDEEYLRVTATGTYAVEDTVVVRYRTREGRSGVNVVVPLVTADGTALLVDRGWMATQNSGATTAADVPAPPSGEVVVTGWVRGDATGEGTEVTAGSTRAISSVEIGEAVGRDVYGGFVELASETPEPAEALAPAELPELDDGPHFFYGLQWFFFGLLALAGFAYLAYDEWRMATGRKPRPQPGRRSPAARELTRR